MIAIARLTRSILPSVALALLAFSARAEPAGRVPVTIVNHSPWPVHATAVTLDAAPLRVRLGLAADAPLRVERAGDADPWLCAPGVEDGRPVLRLYVALPPTSRLDLAVAAGTPSADLAGPGGVMADPSGQHGAMSNGVIRFALEPKGWSLGFDARGTNAATLIRDGVLDFWADDRNRGRIASGDPADLGLTRFAPTGRVAACTATTAADGRRTIVRTHRMGGLATNLVVTETFELAPGSPVLACRVLWRNEGDAPLWIAYTGSGDGIRGRWDRSLMPTPLIERKKSPVLGDLNGSETRCAWVGGLCRISMESPATGCGVGLSTLLPTPGRVGQGSMVWGCGGSGFQCNFIDPEVGQFPFLVKPHGELANGFAFLAAQNGVSVHRQTVALWTALQAGRATPPPPPCAVFVDGEPLHAQTIQAMPDAPVLWPARGDLRRAALRLDFNRSFEARVAVRAATEQEPVELAVRPLAPGKSALPLLRATKPGDYAIALNAAFAKPDETAFVVEARTPGSAAIGSFVVAETLPAAPRPLSPVAEAAVTDFATMFRWASLPGVVDYDVQWARGEDFAAPVAVRVTSSEEFPWFLPEDAQLPAPGRWFWRVRGAKRDIAGAWSAARAFTVSGDHATKPVRRPLTPERPLFTLEATRVLDYTAFHPDLPADLAPYLGIVAEGFEGKGIPVDEFARGMERLPNPILLRSHWVGLADLEWLFQHVPTFAGIQGGEHLSALYSGAKNGETVYHHRLTRLCAKYGMFYQEADGTYRDDKWQDLMDRQGDFVRTYGPWLVLSQKNNIIRRQFYSQSAALGLWLGGLTHQHGAWEDGGFYWQNAGFNGMGRCDGERRGVLETMPRIFWDLVCVMGIGRGCGIYSLDGQTPMFSAKASARDPKGAWPPALWDDTGRTSDTFHRFVEPLVRATVKHRLVPTKDETLATVRLAVYNDRKAAADEKTWTHYAEYGPLYAGTYGFRKMGVIDGQLWEFFPNSGRYAFIPVLPQGDASLGAGIRNLPVSSLQDPARVRAIFDAAYPAWYEGDAFVSRAGNTLTVLNSRENEDVVESFAIPLSAGPVAKFAGRIGPHAYVVGRIENAGRSLWLQANTEYPARDTEWVLTCARKPAWRVEPVAAAKAATWDEASRTLTLHLGHAGGAVEVVVE